MISIHITCCQQTSFIFITKPNIKIYILCQIWNKHSLTFKSPKGQWNHNYIPSVEGSEIQKVCSHSLSNLIRFLLFSIIHLTTSAALVSVEIRRIIKSHHDCITNASLITIITWIFERKSLWITIQYFTEVSCGTIQLTKPNKNMVKGFFKVIRYSRKKQVYSWCFYHYS